MRGEGNRSVSKISLSKIFDYFETGACITLIKMKTSFQMITLADTERPMLVDKNGTRETNWEAMASLSVNGSSVRARLVRN